MKYEPGEFVRAVHPISKRMVSCFIIGSRGRVLEYHVSDGETEWFTFMVRAQAKESPSRAKPAWKGRLTAS